MAVIKNLVILFLYHLLLLNQAYSKCPRSFQCGNLGSLEFPLSQADKPGCGLFMVENCDSDNPRIRFEADARWYDILRNESPNSFFIRDPTLQTLLMQPRDSTCLTFNDISMPKSPHSSITVVPNLTLFTCFNQPYLPRFRQHFEDYREINCTPFSLYYENSITGGSDPQTLADFPECTKAQLPINSSGVQTSSDLFYHISAEFIIQWDVSQNCYDCHHGGGQCVTNTMNGSICKKRGNRTWRLILGVCGGGVALLLCIVVAYIIWQRKKRVNDNYFLSRNMSSNLSSKSDIEDGSFYFGIPIFSYTELEKATNSFDPSKELGDGGFGVVYHGKLRDGREVAIKRLYEQNCRRVEQFINEIKILTSLRHPNLVSLYGCTSRRSRELLLVYEYIPNGTVAEHLHGDRAKESPLTWPTRMSVAIESATALAYLHNSDIIHRDVKTNNILLDSNYRVKVADFGLSRLFPTDVTHISTAPQGTPGYVDPEYHQCYQLTDKSDVYSFGVVLIELISSLPAVDITRHRHEINLANLAVNRIQRCAFDELIDSSLGYDSDAEVTRMTTSVAELAFRCLQPDKDLRPSMDEVVDFLKHIQGGEDFSASGNIPPPDTDDGFFKNKTFQSSPTAVIDRWISTGSTTTSSIG